MIAPYKADKPLRRREIKTPATATVITGIEGMLDTFETSPHVDNTLRVFLNTARTLAKNYGYISIDRVNEFQEQYEAQRRAYQEAGLLS